VFQDFLAKGRTPAPQLEAVMRAKKHLATEMMDLRRTRWLLTILAIATQAITACVAQQPPTPSFSAPSLPTRSGYTSTPELVPTITRTPVLTPNPTHLPSPTPDLCDVSTSTPLFLLDDDMYFSLGPVPNQLERAIVDSHPIWGAFRQVVLTDPWTIGEVYDQAAFGGPEYGVNPAILLISVSMRLDWQIPSDGDLYLRAQQMARELYDFYGEFFTQEQVREAYPLIGNAATYSLYRFFGEDLGKLQQWCTNYQELFGVDYPLRP